MKHTFSKPQTCTDNLEVTNETKKKKNISATIPDQNEEPRTYTNKRE